MKNHKPIVIAAGFFRHRHETLFNELKRRFELRLFFPVGHWPEGRPFPIQEYSIEQHEIENAGKVYWETLTQIETAFDIPSRSDETWRIVQSLLVQWVRSRNIQESLKQFHLANPVAAVVVVNDHLAPHRTLVTTARSLGIPSVYVDHGFSLAGFLASSLKTKNGTVVPVADHVCVDSELQKQILLAYYDSPDTAPAMHVTGTSLDGRAIVNASENPIKRRKVNIVFCPSWYEANSIQEVMFGNLTEHRACERFFGMVKRMQERLSGKSFQVVVKLHPTLTRHIGANTGSYYSKAASRYGLKVTIDDGPIAGWLPAADLLVTSRNSSVAWEAFLCKVPVISYLSDFYKSVLKEQAWQKPTLLANWGVQHYFSDGMDWAEGALPILTSKLEGKFAQVCDQHLAKITDIPAETAARNVADVVAERAHPTQQPAKRKPGKKLKILEVVHDFPPNSYSGTELYTLNLAKELQKLGHDVTVLYPVLRNDRPPYSFDAALYEGVNVVEFNIFDAGRTARSEFLNPAYDNPFRYFLAAHDFDVVHFQHIYGLSANWIAIAKELGTTVFLKIDDMFFYCIKVHLINRAGGACSGPDSLDKCFECTFSNNHTEPNTIAEGYQQLAFRRAYLQKIFRIPDFVQAASKYLKENSLGAGFFNSNFHVIQTGIQPFEALPRQQTSARELTVGFLGYLHVRKGILDFLNAVEIFQKDDKYARLKFLIYGNHRHDDVYRYVVSKVGRLHNVDYRGGFEPKDRPQIFSQLDLLVMPSIGENYPFLLREALLAGVPAAASKIAGIPEIVKHGKNGFLFPPGDAQALAGIFREISQDPTLLQRLKPEGSSLKSAADEAKEIEREFYKLTYGRSIAHPQPVPAPRSRRLAERDRIDLLFEQGKGLVKAGKLADGMAVLSRLLDLKPNHSPTLQLMGDVYHQLGKESEARQMWQLALATAA
ncbi:MAG TPA: glycosyltransferase [bacterium]